MIIRRETPADAPAIHEVTTAAFLQAAHSSGTEARIVDALRDSGSLTLSLVAERDGKVVGHAAFSPIMIDGQEADWFGLGPVAVSPDVHGKGIGSALIREGLSLLESRGARGCVVLGEPGYYGRFGFTQHPALKLENVPPEYFMALPFEADVPVGTVTYHTAFDVK